MNKYHNKQYFLDITRHKISDPCDKLYSIFSRVRSEIHERCRDSVTSRLSPVYEWQRTTCPYRKPGRRWSKKSGSHASTTTCMYTVHELNLLISHSVGIYAILITFVHSQSIIRLYFLYVRWHYLELPKPRGAEYRFCIDFPTSSCFLIYLFIYYVVHFHIACMFYCICHIACMFHCMLHCMAIIDVIYLYYYCTYCLLGCISIFHETFLYKCYCSTQPLNFRTLKYLFSYLSHIHISIYLMYFHLTAIFIFISQQLSSYTVCKIAYHITAIFIFIWLCLSSMAVYLSFIFVTACVFSFVPFKRRSESYEPLLHSTSQYGHLPYGNQYFREEFPDKFVAKVV